MKYGLRQDLSLDTLLDRTHTVMAALLAYGEIHNALQTLVPMWQEFLTKQQQLRSDYAQKSLELQQTKARVRVFDTVWDAALTKLSGKLYFMSDKRAQEPPYSTFFGHVSATYAKTFGIYRATVFGADLMHQFAALTDEQKAEAKREIDAFVSIQTRLQQAADQMKETERALRLVQLKVYDSTDEMETLLAKTEASILLALPGNKELARAIVQPPRDDRKDADTDTYPDTGDKDTDGPV